MRLSTKSRYGLKALIAIGYYANENPVSLKFISNKENISESYLEQLISLLKKEGIVKSTRGAKGGYKLNKDPKEIIVGDVLKTLEGNINIIDCISDEGKCQCTSLSGCSTKLVWLKITEAIQNVVYSITLDDLINDYKEEK